MCRMLAKICVHGESLQYEFIESERSLKRQSKCGLVPPGMPPQHADGCGVAYVKGGEIEVVRRGRTHTWDEAFVGIVRKTRCHLAIGHNRKASPGLKAENVGPGYAHPFPAEFNGVKLAFCHNGGISTLMAAANSKGVTDSEVFLDELLVGIRQLEPNGIRTRISDLAREYGATRDAYTSLTAFLLTPTQLYAWLLYRPHDESRSRPARDWYPGYYTLWIKKANDRVLIASEPIEDEEYDPDSVVNGWERLKNGHFVAMTIAAERIEVREERLDI